jgi:hypothetical protein
MRPFNWLRAGFASVIDLAPWWIWKPANLRFMGSHTVHFCYDGSGHRTVEFDEREIARGLRVFDSTQEHQSP